MTKIAHARVQPGSPTGGQFTTTAKADAGVSLAPAAESSSETYDSHSNDTGDWCPYSGSPVRGGDDKRCPQGCRASDPDGHDDDDEYDEDACETSGCDGRLDDGEGSNGKCGNCADALTCPGCDEEKDLADDDLCRECERRS